ncbi:MAG: NAD(+) synthase [Kiritimatiellae bacterium]|nr:NAD(+) synthase [Kiritimatiellia bacterium]
MTNEFIRIAASVPRVKPGDVRSNADAVASMMDDAAAQGASLIVFPELALTGYTCADLFFHSPLLDEAESSLAALVKRSASHPATAFVVGLPVRAAGLLFNCAAVVSSGSIRGVVPKTYLPGSREFYEPRWFASAFDAPDLDSVTLAGFDVPFGRGLVFEDSTRSLSLGIEICEDMWAPEPPSAKLALGGANVIANPSASNELVGKTSYRRSLVLGQSARCHAAYVYAGAGVGESTTDAVFGGHAMIAENGSILAEGERFSRDGRTVFADFDPGFLAFERVQGTAWRAAAREAGQARRVSLCFDALPASGAIARPKDPHPFVPSDGAGRDARCEEILSIQATGLATRLDAIRCRDAVVGLSGGLDSALALLVAVEAFDRLGLDRKGVHVLTMPGFGTTGRTKGNAELLAEGLGLAIETIPIADAVRAHFSDIGHDEANRDITYENAQARMRTLVLMDRANQTNGIVVGTGDLSELALGWCTYNGDQMSMYGVNAGVPKTLVRHVVKWYAERRAGAESPAGRALLDILATPVSPELLPANADGTIAQETEDKVGPYELHDFFLYNFLRRGAPKEKILRLALAAFDGVYSMETVSKWLDIFFRRFFTQQFKRSAMPDGPKIGSVGLSPRGDWRMPSDASRSAFSSPCRP